MTASIDNVLTVMTCRKCRQKRHFQNVKMNLGKLYSGKNSSVCALFDF